MKESRLLWLTVILFAVAALWHFGIRAQWQQRFPAGWSQEFNFIGISTLPENATRNFPPVDSTGLYQRTFHIIERTAQSVTLQDHYIIRDPLTDAFTYGYTFQAEVDPRTGQHLHERYQGDYYIFPREVQQTTYRIRNSYLEGVPLSFVDEHEIEGLRAYHFAYHGPAEYTKSYSNAQDETQGAVTQRVQIRCADDQFQIDFWVEPITGEILKINESCYAGDYAYDAANGARLYPILRWGAVTEGDDVLLRADQVRVERTHYLWITRYISLLLFGTGTISFVATLCTGILRSRFTWRTRLAGRLGYVQP